MKRRMIWIFLTGALVGIVLSGLYKHFVTDQIMDGGNGMENPDQNLFLLDGDGTYVDNSLLWPVLEGTMGKSGGRLAGGHQRRGRLDAPVGRQRPFWKPRWTSPTSRVKRYRTQG